LKKGVYSENFPDPEKVNPKYNPFQLWSKILSRNPSLVYFTTTSSSELLPSWGIQDVAESELVESQLADPKLAESQLVKRTTLLNTT